LNSQFGTFYARRTRDWILARAKTNAATKRIREQQQMLILSKAIDPEMPIPKKLIP
jgi:hypothetical protein